MASGPTILPTLTKIGLIKEMHFLELHIEIFLTPRNPLELLLSCVGSEWLFAALPCLLSLYQTRWSITPRLHIAIEQCVHE